MISSSSSLSSSSSSSSSSLSSSSSSASIALSTRYAEWDLDPTPIRDAVNAAIGKTAQKQSLLADLVKLVVDYLKKNEVEGFFGPEEWEKFCGKVDPAPALSSHIENIWQSRCPVFPEKRVCETHMFVYIPTTVNGKPLSLKSLGEIAKRYFPKTEAGYSYILSYISDELGDKVMEKSCWVLMTKDVLPGSRNKDYAAQQSMVVELAKKVQAAAYEVPRTLEAAVCILAQYFKSHDSSKTRLFSDNPWTYTRCQEKVQGFRTIVGGFVAAGLYVSVDYYGNDYIGVAALRKF